MTGFAPPDPFAPFTELAAALLPHAGGVGDGSHDLAHIGRVWANARGLQAIEGGDAEIVFAACLLHDCVSVEKNSPLRAQAAGLAAARAADILRELGWLAPRIDAVCHAIAAHSFSAGVAPTSIEARIVQDADRLDALGAVGVARCFYTAGRMGSALYDAADPLGQGRAADDARYALDHFATKLLTLADGFQTDAGRARARLLHGRIAAFRDAFCEEIGTHRSV